MVSRMHATWPAIVYILHFKASTPDSRLCCASAGVHTGRSGKPINCPAWHFSSLVRPEGVTEGLHRWFELSSVDREFPGEYHFDMTDVIFGISHICKAESSDPSFAAAGRCVVTMNAA